MASLDKYHSTIKAVQKISTIGALVNNMENSKTVDEYKNFKSQWDKIKEVYSNETGCTPPPPPPVFHHEMSTIEKQCQKGFEVGYSEAEVWTKLIWSDSGKPRVHIDDPKLTAKANDAKEKISMEVVSQLIIKINRYTKCLVEWFSNQMSVFHNCGKRGMRDGIKEIATHLMQGGEAGLVKEKAKEKASLTIEKYNSRFEKVIATADASMCNKQFKLSTTPE